MNVAELDELIKLAEIECSRRSVIAPLPRAAVERLRSGEELSPMDFCDSFARRVAHEYAENNLSFSTADAAMNALHVYVSNEFDVRLPSYAWEVFLAFDEGEYRHAGDPEGIDPEQKYTRPAISSIVVRDQILRSK